MKPRLFSGIQPSGNLHLGNYLGMIKNAVSLQDNYESLLCIVDLHAITAKQEPETLKKNALALAKHYLASGIDPEKSIIFIQSSVPEHAELCWIMNTFTNMGELERMTQFKDKSRKNQDNINVGLFDYPVLMVADILLYNSVVVPVGEDQTQHLELTRTLAKRFNNRYQTETFTLVEPLIKSKAEGARIMGLDDPSQKMSKSAESPNNYIALTDPPEVAKKKIMRATTDSGSDIKSGPDKPGVTNLLTIYSLLTETPVAELEKKYANKGYGDLKKDLAEQVANFLTAHQEKMQEFDDNSTAQILAEGAQRAKAIAHEKIKEVKKVVGLA